MRGTLRGPRGPKTFGWGSLPPIFPPLLLPLSQGGVPISPLKNRFSLRCTVCGEIFHSHFHRLYIFCREQAICSRDNELLTSKERGQAVIDFYFPDKFLQFQQTMTFLRKKCSIVLWTRCNDVLHSVADWFWLRGSRGEVIERGELEGGFSRETQASRAQPPGGQPTASISSFSFISWLMQVISKPEMCSGKLRKVLSVSDSRDSTSHWMIKDTKLVELIKRGCQPVVSASAWTMEMQGDQPTLNIER